MNINAIKITKEDIEKLNEQGAIYTTKQNREEGNSANANTIWFGDNGEMFIDDQGRIIEKQEDGSEIYMGWTDLDKVTKQKNNRVDVPNNSNRDTKAVDTRLDNGRYVYKDDKSTPTQTKAQNTPTKPGIDVNTDPGFQKQETTTQAKVETSTKSKYAIDVENDPRFANNAKITGINSTSGDFITQINQTKSEDTLSTPAAGTESIFDSNNEQPTTIPTPELIKPIAAVGDTNDKYYAFTRDIMSEINTQRRQQGLPNLQWSDELTKAATIRAEELSQSKSHTRPNGQEWHTALDRDYDKNYGENLAWNYSSPDEFVNNWMNSASHRENLLSGKYNKVGISIYETEDGQAFCAAEFSS